MVDQRTHEQTSEAFVGRPVEIGEETAVVELETTAEMAVDETGLVHGGFVYGAADYAAMLAVNEPTVVLTGSDVAYPNPTQVDETVRATATVADRDPRPSVDVTAEVVESGEVVLSGTFDCAVPSEHVLS
ncbi:PaaI family thioesterase [Halorhabdus amylolytica]|uniref:PaaI family thioesterase n=1 Tax=Halorhabdus amylolytica TaxID=2559573 RepID=UPI0010A9EC91|nr:thioesterase [Halorhabdus amylolytica]